MKPIKIFLASSLELRAERELMASLANSLNTVLESQGYQVIIVEWENLDASMTSQHKQEDYNDKLRECDMCIALYWTKFGMYTKIELDTAYERLKAGENPKKLYVYFKDADELSVELREFRDTFHINYGHFYTPFANFDTLKAHFLLQFMEYLSQFYKEKRTLEVKDGKVFIGTEVFVNLQNVPFAANNEEYNLLRKNIKKTQKLLAVTEIDDPDYADYASELHEMQKRLAKMENGLWDTALLITKLTADRCSERLTRAMELFNSGDAKGAQAILNEEEIEKDVEHNINLIRLGEEGRKGIMTNIDEYRLKVSILNAEMSEGWVWEQCKLCQKIVDLTKILYGDESLEVADAFTKAAAAYYLVDDYKMVLDCSLSALAIRKNILGYWHLDTAESYSDAGVAYGELEDFNNQFDCASSGLQIRQALNASDDLLAESYNTIGCAYLNIGEPEQCLQYNLKCLELRRKNLGEMHPATANAYYNVGAAYSYFDNYEKCIEYVSKGLEIFKQVLGDSHPDTAMGYNNLGEAYRCLGKYDMALKCIQTAIRLVCNIVGEYSYSSLVSHSNLSTIYFDMGNIDDALITFEKVKTIAKEIYGDNYMKCPECIHLDTCFIAYYSKSAHADEQKDIEHTN